jgi:hypothetical protein
MENNNMKKYVAPQVEIEKFVIDFVLTASSTSTTIVKPNIGNNGTDFVPEGEDEEDSY